MKNSVNKLAGVVLLLTGYFLPGIAQNTRINDYNTIGWFTNTTTVAFSKSFSGHIEFQWRRDKLVKIWQQGVYRFGINYVVNPKLTLRAGYGFIETFNYGDYPLQAAGKTFPEHRMYQMASLNDQNGRFTMAHRFVLEQRWVGRFTNPDFKYADDYLFANRFRYMFRIQTALGKKLIVDKTAYIALYDEILIGFGKNVNENVYDQNRIGALLGYRFNKKFRIEAGFIQQLVQFGREINGRNVFQYNNGLIVNTILNF